MAKLKRKNFQKSDKTPRSYDMRVFTLDGRMDLDITFEDRTINTPVYIKMDSPTNLLLSEGVCCQLQILTYHPSISAKLKDCHKESSKIVGEERTEPSRQTSGAVVPMVKVQLIKSEKLLPRTTMVVTVAAN